MPDVTPIPDQPYRTPSEIKDSSVSRVRVRITVSVRNRLRFRLSGY